MDLSGFMTQLSLGLVWVTWSAEACRTRGCQWGEGTSMLVATHCLYLVASIFTRCMRDPRYKRRQDAKDEEGEKGVPEPTPEPVPAPQEQAAEEGEGSQKDNETGSK
jgi:hypothetical protein